MTAKALDYQGFFGASSPLRVTFGAAAWTAVTLAAKAKDDVTVEVSKIAGGRVTGPIKETRHIVQGSLRGTIYYETYGSQLARRGRLHAHAPQSATMTWLSETANSHVPGCPCPSFANLVKNAPFRE